MWRNLMICSFCERICKNDNSLRNHERLCKLNPNKDVVKSNFIEYNKKVKLGIIKKPPVNQFEKAKLNNRTYVVSDETRKKLSEANKNRKKSPETIEKLKKSMQLAVKNNPDSYTASNVSGRTPIIEYNGVKLKGTWEVETAKWLDFNNIVWTNVVDGFEYWWNNSTHLYYPDFYLPTFNLYIEVKGYERDRDREKWKVVNNLIVFKKQEIMKIKNNCFSLDIITSFNPKNNLR
jgi:hypothetical protein